MFVHTLHTVLLGDVRFKRALAAYWQTKSLVTELMLRDLDILNPLYTDQIRQHKSLNISNASPPSI